MKTYTRGEKIFNIFNSTFLILVCVTMVYPFLNALAISFSDNVESAAKIVTIYPISFTLENYRLVLARDDIMQAFFISVSRTFLGIITHVTITGFAAYGLSIKTLPFRKSLTIMAIIPMYLSAGLIPGFVNIYELKLVNTFWVYIFPMIFATYHMLLMRTFFEGIPSSLADSAKVDGAGDFATFMQIILPLSKPIIATIALFVGVSQWNSWFDANIYVPNTKLHPLAMLLRRILFDAELIDPSAAYAASRQTKAISPQGIKTATLVITTAPILLIYPFCQKYFIKGVMIGAVKG